MRIELEHIGLAARDPQALCAWYRAVLSAEIAWTNDADPPAFLLRIPPGLLLEIYPGTEQIAATAQNHVCGWRHFALLVDSIELAQAWLQQRGVPFSDPIKPAGGGGRVLFFRDPEGNLLHLVERPATALASQISTRFPSAPSLPA
jgi:glyoxylase I family protein